MRFPTKDIVVSTFCVSTFCALLMACGGDSSVAPLVLPVASVQLTPNQSVIAVGQKTALQARTLNADGLAMAGKTVSWASSNVQTVAVDQFGFVTGVAAGTATITATSEGKSGTASITVSGVPICNVADTLSLAVGQALVLSAAQKTLLCLGGGANAAEYSLVAASISAASTLNIASINTFAVDGVSALTAYGNQAVPRTNKQLALQYSNRIDSRNSNQLASRSDSHVDWLQTPSTFKSDAEFIAQSQEYVAKRFPRGIPGARASVKQLADPPVEGTTVTLSANFTSITCTGPRSPRTARVVKVLKNVIVYADVLSPDGGYTDAELIALATDFDTLGYVVDTLNFGKPRDIDNNGRIGVFFTPAVNEVGAAGITSSLDLVPTAQCSASNEGEIFYLAVPDAASTIFKKSSLLAQAPSALVHELQHVINAGVHAGANYQGGGNFEVVWLGEGLSHIAEELRFYKKAGLSPGANLVTPFSSTQARDAFSNIAGNFSWFFSFLLNPEQSSPIANNDDAATRGAVWHLLRFAADQKGGDQSQTWRALVNTTARGTFNLTAVFGNSTTLLRSWAVSNMVDDVVPGISSTYTFPSWNFRGFTFVGGPFPLQPHQLTDQQPLSLPLVLGGTAYFRFGVATNVMGTVRATTGGLAPTAEMVLVRTK